MANDKEMLNKSILLNMNSLQQMLKQLAHLLAQFGDAGGTDEDEETPPKKKRGRPAKQKEEDEDGDSDETDSDEEDLESDDGPTGDDDEGESSDDEDETDDEEEEEDDEEDKPKSKKGKSPTKTQVIKALEAYKNKHSKDKAIKVMKKVTGEASVHDVDESDYAKLVSALKV